MTINPFCSATEILGGLQAGAVSSREVLETYLQRVERHNPRLNAVVTLDVARAHNRANAADAQRAGGGAAGALHGLPATIKDSFETAGLRSTCGAPIYSKHVPVANADAVQRLVDAGTVVFGKTNVPIHAGDLQSYNVLFGATNNPWDALRTCGGSSGGATAAVAAGLTAFELGSDIGGSIRIPAHFCGVYGHKPSYGVIPLRGHVPPPPGSLSAPDMAVAGPIARSAEDLDLLLGVLADADGPFGAGWKPVLPAPRARRLEEFRVALWLDDPAFPIDDEVRVAIHRSVQSLRKAGVKLDEAARPGITLAENFDDYLRLLWPATTAQLSDKAFARVQEAGRGADADSLHGRLARYSSAGHREWLRLNEKREVVRAIWRAFFERYDVLLCPVGPVCAFAHDHSEDLIARTIVVNGQGRWYWEQLAWISLATLAYLPAISAPIGRSPGGLPVGMQIIGPYFEDRSCIKFAELLADVAGGFEPPPGFD
ncbi:MAG TPA: amidase [Burkholderiales bacterium]|jgi:amidase|nr:amidase [Burkholderiales bacterium]